jgi:hypothetical protein
MEDELLDLYNKLPSLTKSVMWQVTQAKGDPRPACYKRLLQFLKNSSYHGFVLCESEVQLMRSHIECVVKRLETAELNELYIRYHDGTAAESKKSVHVKIFHDGWRTEDEVLDTLLRPIMFKEILLGIIKPSPYNTVRLKRRYATLWDIDYNGEAPTEFDFALFKKWLPIRPEPLYYKVGYPEDMHFISDRGYVFKSALDDALHGMPVLNTGYPYS